MNLNDCINRLPLILRGRFSSSNNASWLAWAADGISRIERGSVGPGNKRTVMAYQMASGFIPRPPSLCQITGAWLDGVPTKSVKNKDSRGFQMEPGEVLCVKNDAEIDARQSENILLSFCGVPDFLKGKEILVGYIDGINKVGRITGDGYVLSVSQNELAGISIKIDGERVLIVSNEATDPNHALSNSILVNFESASNSYSNESAILEDFSSENIDGSEAFVMGELIAIHESFWVRPTHSASGWSASSVFSGTRSAPGRSISGINSGVVTKSNLLVEGYRRLARPTSMTDQLDLPEGTESLMAAYLRFAAEADQDIASPETAKAQGAFETALQRYTIDQSRTDGATRPTAYQFKVSLSGRRP